MKSVFYLTTVGCHFRSARSSLRSDKRYFFVIKPIRCTNFTNLFWHETLHVSDSSSVHQQEFIHCTLNSGMCHTCLQTAHITLLSVQWINSWWWTEELSETCTVSCQNKFMKLVHLVGSVTNKFVTMHDHTNVKKLISILGFNFDIHIQLQKDTFYSGTML